jgi:hypothetical protein
MRLYDEYLKRHGLCLPLVRHANKSTLLFRVLDNSLWQSHWLLFSAEWHHKRGETGHYEVSFSAPNRDQSTLVHLEKAKIQWDEYDRYFMNWPVLNTGVEYLSREDAASELWQIFQFCHDAWISRQPYEIQEILHDCTDMQRSEQARKASQEFVLFYLQQEYPTILSAWQHDMIGWFQFYADWLVDFLGCVKRPLAGHFAQEIKGPIIK